MGRVGGRSAARGVAIAAMCWPIALSAQTSGYRPARTSFGAPDLQGVWTNLSLTQLERPSDAKSLILDEVAAAALEARIRQSMAKPDAGVGQPEAAFRDEGQAHLARIGGQARSSWITDPADGRLPFTAEGRAEYERQDSAVLTAFDGPESRDISERCLLVGTGQEAPMLNMGYSANYQILQTPREVAIYFEINHEVRIIRLNARHPPKKVRFWMGDSIGHWEKNTLVVETTNFRREESYRQDLLISADAKVVEKLVRVSPTELRYSFRVDDPKTYTRVWRAEMPFRATRAQMFEDACHEGNYALPNTLAGARRVESDSAAAR